MPIWFLVCLRWMTIIDDIMSLWTILILQIKFLQPTENIYLLELENSQMSGLKWKAELALSSLVI